MKLQVRVLNPLTVVTVTPGSLLSCSPLLQKHQSSLHQRNILPSQFFCFGNLCNKSLLPAVSHFSASWAQISLNHETEVSIILITNWALQL